MHQDAMKAKIVEVSKSILSITGIKIKGTAGLTWGSCTDDQVKPFRATVSATFPGQPTLAESEHQVDEWVARLRSHGWQAVTTVPNNATRYLSGPAGFSMAINPHVSHEVQPGVDLTINSDCVVTDHVGSSPGDDVTNLIQP